VRIIINNKVCVMNNTQLAGDQSALLLGALTHLSQYLHSGCPRSVHHARLLLDQLEDIAGCEEVALSRMLIDRVLADQPR